MRGNVKGIAMRGIAILVLSLAMASGAEASSILVIDGAQSADPSIVTLSDTGGGPSIAAAVPALQTMAASPSVLMLGEPAVSDDTVAAIPATHAPNGAPMVIRAGIVGGSSPAPLAASASTAAGSCGGAVKASNGSLRDAMTRAGQAPAIAQ
jgi:CTP:molybdopterin cytidylyltransferase MocA